MPPRRPQLVPASKGRKPGTTAVPAGAAASLPVHPFDARHGTDTGGLIPGSALITGAAADRFVTAYYGVAPSIVRTLLELWQTACHPPFALDRYTFVDIGAGKGRAVLLAAENPFAAVIGVELNPRLATIARENLEKVAAAAQSGHRDALALLAPMQLLEADALTLALPQTPTLLFLFHPFEAPAVRRLLRSVAAQFSERPGQLDLMYVNAEHGSAMDHDTRFSLLWRGRVPMSTEDHLADLKEIETQLEYGSTGDELCAIYRFLGREP